LHFLETEDQSQLIHRSIKEVPILVEQNFAFDLPLDCRLGNPSMFTVLFLFH